MTRKVKDVVWLHTQHFPDATKDKEARKQLAQEWFDKAKKEAETVVANAWDLWGLREEKILYHKHVIEGCIKEAEKNGLSLYATKFLSMLYHTGALASDLWFREHLL